MFISRYISLFPCYSPVLSNLQFHLFQPLPWVQHWRNDNQTYMALSFAPCLPKHQWAIIIMYLLIYHYATIIRRHSATTLKWYTNLHMQNCHTIENTCLYLLPPTLVFPSPLTPQDKYIILLLLVIIFSIWYTWYTSIQQYQ